MSRWPTTSGGWTDWARRVWSFLGGGMWEVDAATLRPAPRLGLRTLHLVALSGRGFVRDRCLLRASALTYATLLSLVPLLTFAFAILDGLGFRDRLEPLLTQNLAAGSEAAVARLLGYVKNTNVGRLGLVGLLALLLTVLALLSNVQQSFNEVWGARETRPLARRFADFFSVLAFGPLLIAAAITMTASLQNSAVVQALQAREVVGQLVTLAFWALPYLAVWIAFAFLYLFMPDVRVRARSAVLGGVVGGTLWQLCQWGYVHFQVGVSRYNAIYGTMAALPVLMVWIYLSWAIVLLGLEVTASHQNLDAVRRERRAGAPGERRSPILSLAVLVACVQAWRTGAPFPSDEALAERLDLAARDLRAALSELVEKGLLARVEGPDGAVGHVPARSPSGLLVWDVLSSLQPAAPVALGSPAPVWRRLQGLRDRLDRGGAEALGALTVEELAAGEEDGVRLTRNEK